MNKEQTASLINRLDNGLEHKKYICEAHMEGQHDAGCPSASWYNAWSWNVRGNNPILIGDILEKMLEVEKQIYGLLAGEDMDNSDHLLNAWHRCGYNKSLQEIAEVDTPESRALLEELNKLFPAK